ncbi:hypothetical protein ACFX4N_11965 [Priestia sp. YIM B13551]|uniref:hypothetical protein n=1 Tax=Priestia sp. YIM B13551 TaxID=3366306 RepID=UPI00366A9F9E
MPANRLQAAAAFLLLPCVSSISSASVRQLQSLQIIDQTAEFLGGLVEELGSVTEKLAKQA